MTNRWSAERAAAAKVSDMMREASRRRLLSAARKTAASTAANAATGQGHVGSRAAGWLPAFLRLARVAHARRERAGSRWHAVADDR